MGLSLKFGRCVSLLAVAVGAVGVWTDVYAQDQIAVYRVLPAQVTRDGVLKLAREAFGMNSPQLAEDNTAFMLQQEQKRLTIWKASGALLFADDAKLWNPDYRPILPDMPEKLGDDFLRKSNLIPHGGELVLRRALIRSAKREDGQTVENHWELTYTLFRIDTGQKKENFPITADLGNLTLRLGESGQVIGLERELGQGLGSRELHPFLDSKKAFDWFQWKVGQGQSTTTITYPYYYFSLQGTYNTGFSSILPGYLGWVPDTDREHLWYYVPATTWAVLARIVSPKDKAQLPAGAPVEFRAEVAQGFGSPPYRYLWYSHRDGILGQLAQVSSFREKLSDGRHVITLWVSDSHGTIDAHTVIIHVGSNLSATMAAAGGWRLGLVYGLVVLGVLLGFCRARRSGLALILCGLILSDVLAAGTPHLNRSKQVAEVASPPLLQAASQQLQQGWYEFWPDAQGPLVPAGKGKLRLYISFLRDSGPELLYINWNNTPYISRFFVPYIEVKPKGQNSLKLNIPNPPKFTRLSKLQNPICDPKRLGPLAGISGLWGVKDFGRELEAHYDLDVQGPRGQKLGTINLVFAFRFYHPTWCRNSRAPEFYPEVRYTVQGFNVERVRVPFRFDVDAAGDSKNDVAMMVKEPLPDVMPKVPPRPIGCVSGAQDVILPNPKPANYTGGELACIHDEFLRENFDNYHQAEELIIAPSCHTGNPCFHFHMLKPALGQKFIAVQNHDNELSPHKLNPPKEPEELVNTPPEPLADIVFWYIAESDKPQDSFAADRLMWPAQFVGFSCKIEGAPFGYPACP